MGEDKPTVIPVAQGGEAFPRFIAELSQSDWNRLPFCHPLNPLTRLPAHRGESDLNTWSRNV